MGTALGFGCVTSNLQVPLRTRAFSLPSGGKEGEIFLEKIKITDGSKACVGVGNHEDPLDLARLALTQIFLSGVTRHRGIHNGDG